jgi:peptidoglycan/LPS O-acetylase OafA/YrhL
VNKPTWIPALTGCRAIAALAVVVDHYQPWHDLESVAVFRIWRDTRALFGFGALGVIFFFALSAFLLTTLSLREHAATGSFSIAKFYKRRVLRIWPLYYTVIASYLVLGFFIREFNAPDNQWVREFWIYPLFIQNWFHVTRSDMGILWTLAVEEQFYFLFPWLLSLVLFLRSWRATAMILLAIASVTAGFRILVGAGMIQPIFWLSALPIHGIYFSSLSYFDVLICGALAGWLYVNRNLRFWPGAGLLIVATILVVGSSPTWGIARDYLLGDANIYVVYFTLLGIAFACAILWLCAYPNSLCVRFLASPPMRWLGTISFGIYMWHIIAKLIVLTLVEKIQLSPSLYFYVTFSGYIGLTIAFAWLSYRFIEAPFLRRKVYSLVGPQVQAARVQVVPISEAEGRRFLPGRPELVGAEN